MYGVWGRAYLPYASHGGKRRWIKALCGHAANGDVASRGQCPPNGGPAFELAPHEYERYRCSKHRRDITATRIVPIHAHWRSRRLTSFPDDVSKTTVSRWADWPPDGCHLTTLDKRGREKDEDPLDAWHLQGHCLSLKSENGLFNMSSRYLVTFFEQGVYPTGYKACQRRYIRILSSHNISYSWKLIEKYTELLILISG